MKESAIQERLRKKLWENGWTTDKLHGSRFKSGLPDLVVHHKKHGTRWIEMKKPGGRLRDTQRALFKRWAEAGVAIWVATSVDDYDRIVENKNPNWWMYIK